MPAFPEAYIDDVASGVQRDYQAGRERRNTIADNSLAGIQLLAEQFRQAFTNDSRLTGAVVAQSLLGSNSYSANDILAMNSVARQPWDAPIAPAPGPGPNPIPGQGGGKAPTVTPTA